MCTLNGIIYVAGKNYYASSSIVSTQHNIFLSFLAGYDGVSVLQSCERYDPLTGN